MLRRQPNKNLELWQYLLVQIPNVYLRLELTNYINFVHLNLEAHFNLENYNQDCFAHHPT